LAHIWLAAAVVVEPRQSVTRVGGVMFDQKHLRIQTVVALATLALSGATAEAKTFTPGDRVTKMMNAKYKLPLYFTLPDSARAQLPADITTSDTLVDYRHPQSDKLGLRLIVTKRSGWPDRMAKSGLIQTGDLMLTFRPEWGGGGAYPNIQMGISHTGVAYVKGGKLFNIDNPMDGVHIGFDSEHYRTLNMIHIIRPRNLTEQQRANIEFWGSKLRDGRGKIYPAEIKFNDDYNAPKYKEGKSPIFVKELGQAALGQSLPDKPLGLYCSEFAWSLLSLRNCAADSSSGFGGSKLPSCVSEPMKPMEATGNYMQKKTSKSSYSGLVDGPMMVIDSLGLPAAEREAAMKSVFVVTNTKTNMSEGHKSVAKAMQDNVPKLETYYIDSGKSLIKSIRARMIAYGMRRQIPDNYSPTSYLINTLLPANNSNRTMDYVATIVIE
jgi:hypothetical protein